ncbi:hypothetical protein Q5P01_021413 [Channa striata]|uniref:Fucose mutarotase n=1 Tax=Channa striata TaxID=64152 RepID=A0AA88LUK9_CHASR|nr:hypothetical protein Q5P01_021413 [Channa striata]
MGPEREKGGFQSGRQAWLLLGPFLFSSSLQSLFKTPSHIPALPLSSSVLMAVRLHQTKAEVRRKEFSRFAAALSGVSAAAGMVVLKGIPSVLSPELLYALAKMGHGDELVLADANFPASSICACGPKEIRADGLGIPQLLDAILKLLPLDTYVPSPAAVMDLVDSDKQRGLSVPVWDTYIQLLGHAGSQTPLEKVERFVFYERAKKAYAVVATGETALYGNLILKKGVIPAELLQ